MSTPDAGTSHRATPVYVLRHEDEFIARPAQVGVSGGAALRFVNVTDDAITVFLPDVFNVAPFTVGPRATSPAVPAPAVKAVTALPYSIFVHEGQTLCRGESLPILIVEP